MANIKLRDKSGRWVIYSGVDTVRLPDAAGGYVTFGDVSQKPTLSAPTMANGTATNPLNVTPNTNNGGFASEFVFTVNGVDLSISGSGITAQFVPWIYSITPLAGGTFTVSCKCKGAGFNDSTASSRSVTMPSATATTGYSSVAGLGNSSPSTLTYTYDEDFPRSFQEVEDTYGNKFIKIPTIYRKVLASSDGQITSYALATSARDSDYKPYPCFVDETNGNAILPYILIGKWCMSNAYPADSIDATPAKISISDARLLCRVRGTGYQQYDWKIHKLFTDLGIIVSRYMNIATPWYAYTILGIKDVEKITYTDGIIWGSNDNPTGWYICENEADYQNAGGGSSSINNVSESDILALGYEKLNYLSPSQSVSITKVGYDANHPFCNYATDNPGVTGNNISYYCSSFSKPYTANRAWCVAIKTGDNNYGNWFNCTMSAGWTESVYYARLCYRPILGATGYVEQ